MLRHGPVQHISQKALDQTGKEAEAVWRPLPQIGLKQLAVTGKSRHKYIGYCLGERINLLIFKLLWTGGGNPVDNADHNRPVEIFHLPCLRFADAAQIAGGYPEGAKNIKFVCPDGIFVDAPLPQKIRQMFRTDPVKGKKAFPEWTLYSFNFLAWSILTEIRHVVTQLPR